MARSTSTLSVSRTFEMGGGRREEEAAHPSHRRRVGPRVPEVESDGGYILAEGATDRRAINARGHEAGLELAQRLHDLSAPRCLWLP